jgi:hypothetical protein
MATYATARRPIRLPALCATAAIALAGASLCACSVARTALGPPQYDKNSPVAGVIATTDVSKQAYPSFLQVPSQPDDVRPTAAWNRNIFDLLAARRQLEAFQVVQPQTFYGAEAFAQQARADSTPPKPADDKSTSDKAAALAKDAHDRATPPSPAP